MARVRYVWWQHAVITVIFLRKTSAMSKWCRLCLAQAIHCKYLRALIRQWKWRYRTPCKLAEKIKLRFILFTIIKSEIYSCASTANSVLKVVVMNWNCDIISFYWSQNSGVYWWEEINFLSHADHWNGYSAREQQLHIRNCFWLQEVGWGLLPVTHIATWHNWWCSLINLVLIFTLTVIFIHFEI